MEPEPAAPEEPWKCSFCAKSQHEVKKLIAGPGINICDECVDLCDEILEEERIDSERRRPRTPDDLAIWSMS